MRTSIIALSFVMLLSSAALLLASGCASRNETPVKTKSKQERIEDATRQGSPNDPYGAGGGNHPYRTRGYGR